MPGAEGKSRVADARSVERRGACTRARESRRIERGNEQSGKLLGPLMEERRRAVG